MSSTSSSAAAGKKEIVLTSSLFVANLPTGMTEERFAEVFGAHRGFEGSRLRQDRFGSVVGFADFQDVECATKAREATDGVKLNAADELALIVQYTKGRSQRPLQQRKQQTQPAAPVAAAQPLATGLPENANNTLFIDGVPDDATERELAHIFRPFAGFQSVRIPRGGNKILCFAVFGTAYQATVAKNALQGYAMDLTAGGSHLYIDYARRRRRREDSDSE